MKRKFIAPVMLLLAISCILGGCLKDKDFEKGINNIDLDDSPQVVDMYGRTSGIEVSSLTASSADTTFNIITVRLLSDAPASNDLVVKVKLDPALVTAYNTANGTHYVPVPTSLYTLASMDAIIPAGSRLGYLKMKVIPNTLAGTPYALGFTLESVSNPAIRVSGNFKSQVAVIGIKNRFDGVYKAVGFFEHPSSPRAISMEYPMTTISVTTSQYLLGDLANTHVNLTVNPDNTVTILPGQGTSGTSASVAGIAGDPVYNNTYDPATKTFKLKYGYPMPGPTRIITEKVTLK